MNRPKRTPEEWLTVVRVSGSTRTVFTEGATDARLLWAACGLPDNVDCRSADEIEYEPSSTAFIGGNKARVLAIVKAHSALTPNSDTAVSFELRARCLVDGDFNCMVDQKEKLLTSGVLVVTDFSNMISTIVSYELIRRHMVSSIGWDISPEDWNFLDETLRYAFTARYHNAVHALGRAAPILSGFLSIRLGNFEFDRFSYLQSYFNVQGAEAISVDNAIGLIQCPDDIRYATNSNDIFGALYTLGKLMGRVRGSLSRDAFRTLLLVQVPSAAPSDPQLKILLEWLADTSG